MKLLQKAFTLSFSQSLRVVDSKIFKVFVPFQRTVCDCVHHWTQDWAPTSLVDAKNARLIFADLRNVWHKKRILRIVRNVAWKIHFGLLFLPIKNDFCFAGNLWVLTMDKTSVRCLSVVCVDIWRQLLQGCQTKGKDGSKFTKLLTSKILLSFSWVKKVKKLQVTISHVA
jgi:hypothetical protein